MKSGKLTTATSSDSEHADNDYDKNNITDLIDDSDSDNNNNSTHTSDNQQ
jgi:hypothetical protein